MEIGQIAEKCIKLIRVLEKRKDKTQLNIIFSALKGATEK